MLDERVASSPVSTGFHGGISPLQRDEFRGRTIRETALCHRSLGVEALAEPHAITERRRSGGTTSNRWGVTCCGEHTPPGCGDA